MSYSFEYIDIILLAMIAGFIFLRLRGILGKKTGYEEDMSRSFAHDFPSSNPTKKIDLNNFDEKAKSEFLEGFDDIRITNYTKSNNTLNPYIHYRFKIPNKNLSLTKSGN